MRYLVISDLHGAASEVEKALSYYQKYECDYIVLLGDLLNHGPRNPLASSYNPPKVAELLNAYKKVIISVRGNCDSEVDSMMFEFPCNAPYGHILVEGKKGDGAKGIQHIFLTHGHLHPIEVKHTQAPSPLLSEIEEHDTSLSPTYEENKALREKLGLKEGDIVLSGHTHVAGIFRKENGLININPGSTTLPKGGTEAGFAIIFEDRIELRTVKEDKLVGTYNFIFS